MAILTPQVLISAAAARRILGPGFDAVAEYNSNGQVLRCNGQTSAAGWTYMSQYGISGSGFAGAVAQGLATQIIGDTFLVALGIAGGGTLVALVNRAVVGQEADRLARALQRALSQEVGPEVAPWAALGVVVVGAVLLLLATQWRP